MKINFKQSPKAIDYKIPERILKKYSGIDNLEQYSLQSQIQSLDSLNNESLQQLITGFKNVVNKYKTNRKIKYSLYENMSLYRKRYADFNYLNGDDPLPTHIEYLTQIADLTVDDNDLTFSESLYNLSVLDNVANFTNNAFNISNSESSVSKYVSNVVDTFKDDDTTLYNKNAFAAKLGRPVIILKSNKDLGIRPGKSGFFVNTGNNINYTASDKYWCSDFYRENNGTTYIYCFYEPLSIETISGSEDLSKKISYNKNSHDHIKIETEYSSEDTQLINGVEIEIYVDRYFAAASNTIYSIGTVREDANNNSSLVPVNTGNDNHFDSGYKQEQFQKIREKASYPGGDENLKNNGYYYAGIVRPQINQNYSSKKHYFRVALDGSLGNFHSFYVNINNANNGKFNCFAMMEYTDKKVPLLMRKTVISDKIALFQFPEYLSENNPDLLTHYTGWTLAIPDGLTFIKAYQTRPFYNDYSVSLIPKTISSPDIEKSYNRWNVNVDNGNVISDIGSLNFKVSGIILQDLAATGLRRNRGFTLSITNFNDGHNNGTVDQYGLAVTYTRASDKYLAMQNTVYVLINLQGPSNKQKKLPGTSTGIFRPQTFIGGLKIDYTDETGLPDFHIRSERSTDRINFYINEHLVGFIGYEKTDGVFAWSPSSGKLTFRGQYFDGQVDNDTTVDLGDSLKIAASPNLNYTKPLLISDDYIYDNGVIHQIDQFETNFGQVLDPHMYETIFTISKVEKRSIYDIFPLGYNGSYKIFTPSYYIVDFTSYNAISSNGKYVRKNIISNQTRLGLSHLDLEISNITFSESNLKGFSIALHDARKPTAALDGYGIAITYLKQNDDYYVLLNACGPSSPTSDNGLWYYPGTAGQGYFIPKTFIGGLKLSKTTNKYTIKTEVRNDSLIFKINGKDVGKIPVASTDDVVKDYPNDLNYSIYFDKKTHNLVFRSFKVNRGNNTLTKDLETSLDSESGEIHSEYMSLTYVPQTTKGAVKNITVGNNGIVTAAEFDTRADYTLNLQTDYTTFTLKST